MNNATNEAHAVSFTLNTDNIWVVRDAINGDVSAYLPLGFMLWSDGRLMAVGDAVDVAEEYPDEEFWLVTAADRDAHMLALSNERRRKGCTCYDQPGGEPSIDVASDGRWCTVEFVHVGECLDRITARRAAALAEHAAPVA